MVRHRLSRGVANSPTRRVGELSTPWLSESGSPYGESGSCNLNFLKFIIDLQNFKRLNQPFKGPIWQKRSQGCNVLSQLICLKVWKKGSSRKSYWLPDVASRRVVFQLRISPQIRSQNRNGWKGSVRDSWGTDFSKNPRKSASLPCPFQLTLNIP